MWILIVDSFHNPCIRWKTQGDRVRARDEETRIEGELLYHTIAGNAGLHTAGASMIQVELMLIHNRILCRSVGAASRIVRRQAFFT